MSFRSRTCFGKRKKRNCRSLQRDPTTNKQQWRRRRKPTRLLLNVCRPGQGQTANCKKDKEGDKRQKAALAAFWKISQPPLFSPKKTKKKCQRQHWQELTPTKKFQKGRIIVKKCQITKQVFKLFKIFIFAKNDRKKKTVFKKNIWFSTI